MPDLSEFMSETLIRKKGCSVSALDLSDEQKAKIDAALAEPSITGEAISRVLKSWGVKISGNTIQRHRKKQCSCD